MEKLIISAIGVYAVGVLLFSLSKYLKKRSGISPCESGGKCSCGGDCKTCPFREVRREEREKCASKKYR